MKPVKFKQQNCIYAKDQPEYLSLSAHKSEDGMVTTCWKLSFAERIGILITGKIWWQIMTFNKPLQPQRPSIKSPLKGENK
jgi:hypothetical protein